MHKEKVVMGIIVGLVFGFIAGIGLGEVKGQRQEQQQASHYLAGYGNPTSFDKLPRGEYITLWNDPMYPDIGVVALVYGNGLYGRSEASFVVDIPLGMRQTGSRWTW